MIRYIPHQDIDIERWDACIRSAANSRIYAFSWYLDIVADSQWDALVEDDYLSVCPLPFRRKWGISYIFTPFFIQQLGIFSTNLLNTEVQNEFLHSIPKNYKLVELNLNTENAPDTPEFTYVSNLNLELDLKPPYEFLRAQYSENLKRNLKKSKDENISVTAESGPDQVIELFRNERGRLVKHWGDREYLQFRDLTAACAEKEKVCILSAFNKEHEFIAGAVFFISNDRALFIFSATGPKAKAGGAMAAIIDTFIREQSGKPGLLDFEGSNDPGLARFYAGFGARETSYCRAVSNKLPQAINIIRGLKKQA